MHFSATFFSYSFPNDPLVNACIIIHALRHKVTLSLYIIPYLLYVSQVIQAPENKKTPVKIDFIRIFLRFLLLHSLFCGPDQFLQPFVAFSDGNIGTDHLFTFFHDLYCFPEMLLSDLAKRVLCDHPGGQKAG